MFEEAATRRSALTVRSILPGVAPWHTLALGSLGNVLELFQTNLDSTEAINEPLLQDASGRDRAIRLRARRHSAKFSAVNPIAV
jgi:hypothetical protein